MELETDISPPASVLTPRMPILVVELLLAYLDIFALKTFRLVCKATKSLVETPENLRHFVIRITGEARLHAVLSAPEPVPWNSFVFTEKGHCISHGVVQRFLTVYGRMVEHLRFDGHGSDMEEALRLHLLSGCARLETLESCSLMSTVLESEQLLGNWKNLQHIHVQYFPGAKAIFFSKILSNCTKLKTLTVPHFGYQRHRNEVQYADNFQRLVVTPLLNAIAQGRLRSVTLPNEGFDNDQFLRLAIACRESGTVLYTRRSDDSLWRPFHFNLPFEHLSVLNIMGNLNIVADRIICHPLNNVRRIDLASVDFYVEYHAFTLPAFPHLSEVGFYFYDDTVYRHTSLERFVSRLVQVRRPTVKRLAISYRCPHRQIRPVELCTSFVNLRTLHVFGSQDGDDEWLKLWPLVGHTLVELWLENCPNLSDRGILGDDPNQPAFLQLKQLRRLWLRNKEDTITERSFLHAFCHMPLQMFRCTCPRRFSAEAVEAMWSGRFGETFEGEEFLSERNDEMPDFCLRLETLAPTVVDLFASLVSRNPVNLRCSIV